VCAPQNARTDSVISLINTNGIVVAQLSKVAEATSPAQAAPAGSSQNEASAPQRGAPAPTSVSMRINLGDYVLTELGGLPVAVRAPSSTMPQPVYRPNTRFLPILPTLYVRENGVVSGLAGCNQFNGGLVEGSAGSKLFGPIGTTKKACLDRAVTRTEQDILTAMRRAVRVNVGPNRVDLLASDGTRLARFGAVGAGGNQDGPSLYGPTWTLRRINTIEVEGPQRPNIVFEGNRASGFGGCNRFSATHQRRNGRSEFSQIATTAMACLRQRQPNLETDYLAALQRVTIIDLTSDQLTLRTPDRGTILVFEAD
jgi:heat shock protein HslJ